MSVVSEAVRRWWQAFNQWRRVRPFWGGVFTIVAAIELMSLSAAPLHIYLVRGLAGIGTVVIAAMLIALAVFSWTQVQLRTICGVFIVILGLASFAVSNLGGFFIGLLLSLVGGCLIYAWIPPIGVPGTDEGDRSASVTSGAAAAATGDTPAAPDDPEAAESDGAQKDRTALQPDPMSGPRVRPAVPILEPVRRHRRWPRLIWTVSCVVVVVVGTSMVVPQASARPASVREAEPTVSWSWPWPTGSDEPSTSSESSESSESGEPGEPGGDDPPNPEPDKPDEECDREALPDEAPELASQEAEAAAKAVAACLSANGSTQVHDRDLPTASAIHPQLTSAAMTMSGLDYGGVVDVPTTDGGQRALEFTMDSLDIADMDQSAAIGGSQARLHVINMDGSAVLSGDVKLYVKRMEGLIYGVVPIVLTPDSPPPLIVPNLVITEAKVETVYTRADTVDLPGLREPTR